MSPMLQTLVNNSGTFNGVPTDQRNLLLAYLSARATGSMTLTAPSLKALVQDFPGFSDDNYLNVRLYQLSKNLGLPTNGPAVVAIMRAALQGDAGLTANEVVQDILQYAELRRLGAI